VTNHSKSWGESGSLTARAVVFEEPETLTVRELALTAPGHDDVLVDVEWTGISTGTEKLLWSGKMPTFPGMGYPLVPGYETVGRVSAAGEATGLQAGERVFVSGARCFGEVRGLFGGAASKLVVDASKLVKLGESFQEEAVLLALAATAHHALHEGTELALPGLVVGHGVLGRLLARLTIALGGKAPTVWETNAQRTAGGDGYRVVTPDADERRDYSRIVDASGDPDILDSLVQRLNRNGEIVLAGFYSERLAFTFPPAFMREAKLRVAAEWAVVDLRRVKALVDSGALSLADLISHRSRAEDAERAYPTAFSDPQCLKMVLDWRTI
jgi:3-hydroxyethyl bacteriochlorophyllide a dehydrogenase